MIAAFCLSTNIFAQAESKSNKETEIVIIKKVVDENGVESEEKIVLTGKDAEKYIKEQGIKITEKPTGKDGEVEMTVEVTAEGDADQMITVDVRGEKSETEDVNIWISDEGEEHQLEGKKMIFLDSDGEALPEDIKKMLEEKGVDITNLLGTCDTTKTTEVKKYKVVELDDDGNKNVMEWNGEGEMPAEMKKLMEEHGLEEDTKVITKKIMINEDVEVNTKGAKKTIKIKKSENGNESVQVIELNEGEEMPQEVLDLLKEHDVDLESVPEDGKVRIRIEKEGDMEIHEGHIHESPANKAQLGVMIEDSKAGVIVSDLVKGGAAETAGVLVDDIIVKVDKTSVKTYDKLVNALADKVPGDKVKLTVFRDGKVKKLKLNMQAAQKIETKATSENYRTEHKVLKIKGGDIVECKKEVEVEVETRTEDLTEKEIEVIEERIVENSGQQVKIHSGPNTLDISQLDLFPNPTDGNIRIRFVVENDLETNVKIIDIACRTIYEKNMTDFDGNFDEQIDLPRNQLGTLVLMIAQGKNVFTEKIILN